MSKQRRIFSAEFKREADHYSSLLPVVRTQPAQEGAALNFSERVENIALLGRARWTAPSPGKGITQRPLGIFCKGGHWLSALRASLSFHST